MLHIKQIKKKKINIYIVLSVDKKENYIFAPAKIRFLLQSFELREVKGVH